MSYSNATIYLPFDKFDNVYVPSLPVIAVISSLLFVAILFVSALTAYTFVPSNNFSP